MTSRSRWEINSSIVFAGVDGPVPHYGVDAICPETQFRRHSYRVEGVRLYESYLTNFTINTGRE